ncbi:MAG: hypothetical protein MUC31_02505, partial [Bacteroidales bacterium]|nr:hypothetical protein [Bacteroidales bacterium]
MEKGTGDEVINSYICRFNMKYVITIALIFIILYLIGNMDWSSGGKKEKKQKPKESDMAKMRFAKWIGGGLGWAFGGPIGGILG